MKQNVKKSVAILMALALMLTAFSILPHAAAEPSSGTEIAAAKDLIAFSRDYASIVSNAGGSYRAQTASSGSYASARLIVKAAADHYDFSALPVTGIARDPEGIYILQFSGAKDARNAAQTLSQDPHIVYAEEDGICVAAEQMVTQSAGSGSSHLSWGVSYIGADKYADHIAENYSTTPMVVAVVDSGTSPHTFLNGRTVSGYDFVDNDTSPADENGHGTHVSGTIVDCTPGLNVKIMPVRVLDDDGSGSMTEVATGVRYAANSGAKVINMSLGGLHSSYVDDAVLYAVSKGVTVVVAAGNSSLPASLTCPAHIEEAITVMAIDASGKRASFSNWGSAVDVAAPGVNILSCVPDGYESCSGTSMAAPHVSAAAAMLRIANPDATPAQVQSMIKSYTRSIGDVFFNVGALDLTKAIPGTLTSVSITKQPNKLTYYVGDSFNRTGMTVRAEYADRPDKTVTNYTCSPETFTEAGTRTVTVSYTEGNVTKTAETVPVLVKTPTLTVTPSTVNVEVGSTASVVYVTEPSGQNACPTTYPECCTHSSIRVQNGMILITGNSVGRDWFDLTMTYGGKNYYTPVTINVVEQAPTLESLTLLCAPDKTSYYIGDYLDLTGIRLRAVYSDGSVRTVTEKEFSSNTQLTAAGTRLFSVQYTEGNVTKAVSFPITVNTPAMVFSPSVLTLTVGEQQSTRFVYAPKEMRLTVTGEGDDCICWNEDGEDTLAVIGTKCGTAILKVEGVYRGYTYTTALTVNVERGETEFDYAVLDDGSGARITGYSGNSDTVRIPSSIDGYPIRAIGEEAFAENGSIRQVVLPNGVTGIGEHAFYACANLTSVVIPDSVTQIGDGAFGSCICLTDAALPDSVTHIGAEAFCFCTSLTSITLPDSVTQIGDYAFYAASLTEVHIPRSVQEIGVIAFFCAHIDEAAETITGTLQRFTVDAENPMFTAQDGVLYTKDRTELIQYPAAHTRTVFRIPDSVTSIRDYALCCSDNLTGVTIPDGVTTIGWGVFARCSALEYVHIPRSVHTISTKTFDGCGACICSDTADCYAKTFAERNGMDFRCCTGHDFPAPTGSDAPRLILSDAQASAGCRVDVTLSVADNPGIVAACVRLTYDQTKLRLVGVRDGGLLGTSSFSSGRDLTEVPYRVIWEDGLSTRNYDADGVLATFTFEISEDVPDGTTIPITLDYVKNSTFNVDLQDVGFALTSGVVQVTNRLPGDVNADGIVDLKDVTVLRRYLSGGWNVTIRAANADVNADGVLDLKDAVAMRRYLSGGWNVTLQ